MKYICQKDCPDRHPRCHVDCEKFAKYMAANEQNKKERHQEIAVKVYQVEQKNKHIRENRNHRKWRTERSNKR